MAILIASLLIGAIIEGIIGLVLSSIYAYSFAVFAIISFIVFVILVAVRQRQHGRRG